MQESGSDDLQRGGRNLIAYFTDPMGEEFRKALEEAMKEGANLDDPEPDSRATNGAAKEHSNGTKNLKSLKKKRRSKHSPKKPMLSPRLAKELR